MINLNEREEKILDYWKTNSVDESVRLKNRNCKKFYFLDGPPYVTGNIASHHIWVVTIKDIVLRYKRYNHYNVHDRPGFDVHGLPIENKVERKLGIKSKNDIESKIGVEEFIRQCKNFAEEQMKEATKMYIRYGYSANFNETYIPLKNAYMSKGWMILKKLHKKNLIYSDMQALAFCPQCGTVLSSQGPEIEYSDETDASIFVKFPVLRSAKLQLGKNAFLVVWTTTPWTLPANMAIAANPKARYVVVESNGENYVIAKERLDAFVEATNLNVIIKNEFYGSELGGLQYSNPLENKIPMQNKFSKYHKVLLDENLVSISEGTGLLHVAPGHGPEDYKLGKENKIPIFSPVDEHAHYTEEAGAYKGLSIPSEANIVILRDLKDTGNLLFQGEVKHTYPHCWRCGSKLIFRATKQWFVNVKKLKKKMLIENKKIKWHPDVAQKWQEDAIESSPDWCISRQRYWGTPIPIWVCGGCNSFDVIGSIEELVARAGLAAAPEDIHKPHVDKIRIKCDSCGETMQRIPDVFDVWYDSGVSHTASLTDEEFNELFPADWITESRDQIRGWFSMLLRTSVGAYGRRSFNEVNIGGMILDEIGREMHRHLGNSTNASDLLNIASADGYRLWNSRHPRWQELRLKKKELEESDGDILTLYNIAELVKEFASLSSYDLKNVKRPNINRAQVEDRFILSKLNSLISRVNESMRVYSIDEAINEIRHFFVEDFSRFYLRYAKQNISYGTKSELKKTTGVAAYVLRNVLILISIVTPFSAEYIFQNLFSNNEKSIFLQEWPKSNKRFIDDELEKRIEIARGAISAILSSREKAGVTLRWPIAKATIEVTDDQIYTEIQEMSQLIEGYTNAKKLEIIKVSGVKKEIKPLYAKLGPVFKSMAGTVADALKSANPEDLEKGVAESGEYLLRTQSGNFTIKPEHFTIIEKAEEGERASFNHGIAYIDKKLDRGLMNEALVRELTRHVQLMRKEAGLSRLDKIDLGITAPQEIMNALNSDLKSVKRIIMARRINEGQIAESISKKVDIAGMEATLYLKKDS
jgi:isoleucyl-tRNA synthetase